MHNKDTVVWNRMDGDQQRRALLDLMSAIGKGDLQSLRHLIEEVRIPLGQRFFGKTALAEAIKSRQTEAVLYLTRIGTRTDNEIIGLNGEGSTELSLALNMCEKAIGTSAVSSSERILEIVAKHSLKNGTRGDAGIALDTLQIIRDQRNKQTSFSAVVGRLNRIASGNTGDSHRNAMVHRGRNGKIVVVKTF
ncbi:MAG: hypothetical protein ABIG39_04255 [Candidatus Micrarchaeota archaeon]